MDGERGGGGGGGGLESRLPRSPKMARVTRRGGASAPPPDPRPAAVWGAPWRSRRCHFSRMVVERLFEEGEGGGSILPLRSRASRSRGPSEP